jgi:hypothetical protein
MKCNAAASNVVREAITLEDPESEDNREDLEGIMERSVGKRLQDIAHLDVDVDGGEWVTSKVTILITNPVLKQFIGEVSTSITGRIE